MAHFAQIDDQLIVQKVIVVNNDVLMEGEISYPQTEIAGRTFIANVLRLSGQWLQTSYNGSFRGRFAGKGFTYDPVTDEFVPPGWEYINGEWQDPNPPETD